MSYPAMWMLALIIFSITEGATVSMVAVWFIGGSIGGLISALMGADFWLQLVIFVSVSVLMLLCFGSMVRKYMKKPKTPTNVDSNIGKIAVVTEKIDNIYATGAVKLGGIVWTARSCNGQPIEEASIVRVEKIEGVKVYVQPVKIPVK